MTTYVLDYLIFWYFMMSFHTYDKMNVMQSAYIFIVHEKVEKVSHAMVKSGQFFHFIDNIF